LFAIVTEHLLNIRDVQYKKTAPRGGQCIFSFNPQWSPWDKFSFSNSSTKEQQGNNSCLSTFFERRLSNPILDNLYNSADKHKDRCKDCYNAKEAYEESESKDRSQEQELYLGKRERNPNLFQDGSPHQTHKEGDEHDCARNQYKEVYDPGTKNEEGPPKKD
jgi:hypothetical protein